MQIEVEEQGIVEQMDVGMEDYENIGQGGDNDRGQEEIEVCQGCIQDTIEYGDRHKGREERHCIGRQTLQEQTI